MPVCKFYLRGNCRKGDNCNFEHVSYDSGDSYNSSGGTSVLKRDSTYDSGSFETSYYDDSKQYNKRYESSSNRFDRNVQGHHITVNNDYYIDRRQDYKSQQQYIPPRAVNNDRFHYDSRQKQELQPQQRISINDIYSLLKSDIQVVEQCQIWPLTSLCVIKLFGSLDDWFDYSPEEVRFAAYIAKASNNIESYKSTMDKIFSRAQMVRDFYKNTSKEASAKIKKYLSQQDTQIYPLLNNELDFTRINYENINFNNKTEITQPQFGVEQSTDEIEMSSLPKTEELTHNVFNVQQDTSKNVFGSFTQESKDVFSQESKTTFNNSSQINKNIFGGFAQNDKNSFSSIAKSQGSSIFGGSQFGFNQNPLSSKKQDSDEMSRGISELFPILTKNGLDVEILSLGWHGHSPYSLKTEISEEEYEQFKANKFSLDKLPLVPPPKELC